MKSLIAASLLALCATGANAQAPSVYNTISGIVWMENNNDDIRQSDEPRIGGILAILKTSTGQVVSTAISDTNGHYALNNYIGNGTFYIQFQYPSAGYNIGNLRVGIDRNVNSCALPFTALSNMVTSENILVVNNFDLDQFGLALRRVPNTRTYWSAKAVAGTDWSNNFKFPKWVDSEEPGATLQAATVFINHSSFHPLVQVENTSTSAPSAASIAPGGSVFVVRPAGDTIKSFTTPSPLTATLEVYDGIQDYAGLSGKTWYNISATGSSTSLAYGADLSLYKSSVTDSITMAGQASGQVTLAGGGNLTTNITTDAGAGVFLIYTADVPLAISLSSFSAKADAGTALIQWAAASDGTPNEYFVVEHSTDGRNFTEIGKVSANTENNSVTNYQFRHQQPAAGKNFYRLKLHEVSGNGSYSQIATVVFGKAAQAVTAFPVPADAQLNIDGISGMKAIRLVNITGQDMTPAFSTNGDRTTLQTGNLPNGTYFLQLMQADGSVQSQRIVIQHR